MVVQVGAQVIGNDAAVTFSAASGNFELNTMMPILAYNLLQSIELLTRASHVFAQRCVQGLEADVERCESQLDRSLAMCTGLAPEIGYDKAARIAKVAYETGRTVREVASELSGLEKSRLDRLLDPKRQIGPEKG
jgi:fumarate hydratase class II